MRFTKDRKSQTDHDGFQTCLQENNTLVTSIVMTPAINTNYETPNERHRKLACEYYVNLVI